MGEGQAANCSYCPKVMWQTPSVEPSVPLHLYRAAQFHAAQAHLKIMYASVAGEVWHMHTQCAVRSGPILIQPDQQR